MAMTVDEAKLALLNNSNLVEYILFNMPQDDRMQLISKYDTVCKSIVNKGVQLDSNITSNLPSMSILLNKLVVRAAINSITAAELNDKFPSLRDVLKTIRKSIETAKASGEKADSDYISLISFMKTKIGVNVADDVSVDSLKDAILQFSVSGEAITSSEEPDESEEENIPVDWDENDKETLSVSDESDSDIDIDSASTIEKIEKISKKNGGQITNAVRSLVDKLDFLYGDSFQAMPHVGIYTLNSQGSCSIIRVKGGKLSTLQDEYYSSDSSLMAAIVSMLNQFKSTSALPENKNEIFVPINQLPNDSIGIMLTAPHLYFQSADINYCTRKYGIKSWVKEEKLGGSGNAEQWLKENNNGKIDKLASLKLVKQWWSWVIRKYIYHSLIEIGVATDIDNHVSDVDISAKITEVISKVVTSLSNVIVVAERKKGVSTRIKISTSTGYDSADLIEAVENKLNPGLIPEDRTIKIKEVTSKGSIHVFDVMFDLKEANKSNLWAKDVLDNIISSGEVPSWEHALLGKKLDGQYLFWDNFANPGNETPLSRCYAIYASSRSGKGVMTSTLIANALCSQKQIFYTDRKPENGAVFGRVAWKDNKEAYVVNGRYTGDVPFNPFMENYTYGMRQPDDVFTFRTKLPKKLFEDTTVFSENDVKEFMGYMRYAKSLFLCSEVILSRAAGNNSEKWQIWVFDELQSLAEQEVKIRKAFGKYAAAVTGKNVSDDVKGVKGLASVKGIDEYCNLDNPKFDEGIAYIVKWLGFMERLLSNVHEAATIALGKARMNLIFIFQTTSWLKSDTSSGMPYTTIAKILNGLNCTKIVGRNAIENDSGVYGNGNVASSKWYKTVCIDGAMNWAISPVDRLGSTSNEDGTGGNVTLFKPFNLWTEPLKPDKTLDLGASSDPNEKRKYFAGYVEELLGNFGLSAADIINDAFQFANQAVVNLGLVSDSRSNLQPVFNYLYDPFDMTGRDNSFTLEGMRALEAKNDAQLAELDAEDNKQAGVTKGVDLSNIAVDGVEDSLTSAGVPINESELLAKPSQAISSQIPNFMSATKLFYAVSHANLTDEVIIGYVSKYLKPYVDAIDEDKYDIFRRDTDSNKISLWSLNHLVRVVGSMHVLLSLRGDMWLQSEIGNHVVSIIKNPSNASSLMLSFLMSQYNNSGNKNLYDRLPSESKVKSCIDFYNNSMMQKVNEQQQSAPYQGEAASDINYEDIYGNGEDASLSDEEAPVTTVQQVQNPIPDFRDFKAEANISNNQTGFDDRMNQAINRNQQQSQVQNNQQVSQSQIVDANGRPIFSNRNPEQQPKQQQINTFSDDVIQRAKVIEVAAANTQPNYQMIAGDDIVFRAIRPTTNCIRIPDASMMVSSSPIMRFRKRLYESKNGTSYALSITWDSVLKKIEYDVNYDRLLVSRFSIGEDGTNTIRVNNTITESLDRVIDAEFGVELGDIVNLHKTFKRFPNISILILGAGSDVALLNEYGADVKEVWKIFQQNQKLKTIIIVKPGSQPVKYDRATFAKDAVGMDKQLKLDQARKELELAMAYKDPDVDKKPMVMHRANTFLTGSAGASFDNGLDALKGDGRGKILRWGLWSILGLGVGFLGVATGIPGEIGLRHKAHKAKRLQKKVSKLENSIKKES